MDYAAAEKQAAQKLDLRQRRWQLLAALVLFAVGLVLPHSGSVRGLDVLMFNANTDAAQIGIAEVIFVLFGTASAVVLNALTLLTRRAVFASLQYLVGGIALLFTVFALWMRIQSHEIAATSGLGIGVAFEVIAVIVQVYALSFVVFGRSEAQRAAAQARAENNNLDAVGRAQHESTAARGGTEQAVNHLLIDDRRKRAAEKHRPANNQDAS